MFEYIKQRIIKNLTDEILCLSPTNLELVGHNVISIKESKRLIHHGINKDYKPSGYTVDSFSDNSLVVIEYSTDKDYFIDVSPEISSCYKKIKNDIDHAINHNPPNGPEIIYLISNQEEPPSFRSKFNNTPIAQSQGYRTIIYDAREIAKLIYEQSIENVTNADFFKQFFPSFSRELDNYEYYGKVPAKCEKHISEPRIINAITRHFENGNHICVLNGLSGSGKTQAAIDFIHHEEKNFTNYIWISGEDWALNTSLNAIKRTRGGAPVNVAGIFNSSKTILVIDSIERNLDKAQLCELTDGFNKGSIVLATSQIAVPGSRLYLAIPTLSEEVARCILGEECDRDSEVSTAIVKSCKFSPLILSTIRRMIELEGIKRNELYAEVLNSPDEISGSDGSSIMRRILSKLDAPTTEALKKIANTGVSAHDIDFLRYFTDLFSCRKLQQLSILMPTNTPGIVKIHDLICLSMQDNLNNYEIAHAIRKYIDKDKGEMTPSVLRQIHLCYKQIKEIIYNTSEQDLDWLTYAILQVEGEERFKVMTSIYDNELNASLTLSSIMCIIEAKELYSYEIDNQKDREIYYKKCAETYKRAFEESSQNDIKAELLHHRGKALRRCKQYEDSYQCFLQLLELKPHWHATYGQIVSLGATHSVDAEIKKAGQEYMRTLLTDILQNSSIVPLRVSLATIAKLRSYPMLVKEISSSQRDVEMLADIIAMSAFEGLGQFYEAFVAFTSMYGYHHSLICIRLVEALPEMLAMPPEMVDKEQWVSACEALSNTATAAIKQMKSELFAQLSNASIKFAQKISSKNCLRAYDTRVVAKAYITGNMPEEALKVISLVPKENIDHWILYRKAEAQLKTGDNSGALKSVDEAFILVEKDSKAQDRISIYHDLKSKCYEQLGNIGTALSELRTAIEKCTDSQYKQELEVRAVKLEE